MTREELKAIGIADEHIDGVMTLHGKALTDVKNAAKAEKETMQTELNRYQKGGDLFVDGKEFNRLKEFEQTTLKKEVTDKKTKALTKLFMGANANESSTKLLIKCTDLDSVELDENEEAKNGADILKKAKADYADIFAGNGNDGVPQTPNVQTATRTDKTRVVY